MNHTRKLNRTVLHSQHLHLGARMGPFGGYELPIQYRGIVDEHLAARQQAAVFDTCHMGEFRLTGPNATADLERLLSCDVQNLSAGRCRYGLLCNENGGVIDDLLVYRLTEDQYMLVVNSSTADRDREWVEQHISSDTSFADDSATTAKLDLQGPSAPALAKELLGRSIEHLIFFSFHENHYQNQKILVSRTGYTGEVGFEIYCPLELAEDLWKSCIELGAVPSGLGARDTLRLEMGMPLYGHELNEDRNAGETGFSHAIAEFKDFIGSGSVRNRELLQQRLSGIALPGRRAAREGNSVLNFENEKQIGVITSGCFAPSLGHPIALAYIDRDYAEIGGQVKINCGRRELTGEVVDLPFYRDGTVRLKLSRFLNKEK